MMLSSKFLSSLWVTTFSLLTSLVSGLSPISVKGTKLYDGDGKQFFLKGVVYVGGTERPDPLIDTNQCKIDAGVISALGANAIYIYSIDAGKLGQHKGCMNEFAKAGIYVWLQLGAFPMIEARSDTEQKWTLQLFNSWTPIIDSFSAFDNLLAFGIGQETINVNANTTLIAPHLKAAARDLKAFRDARTYRKIPISYSAGDFESYRLLTAQYLSCGAPENTIDLFGINLFSNCSDVKYDRLRSEFANHNTPVVFSENGCTASNGVRLFSEVSTLMGKADFQQIFSGMNIFEWGRNEFSFGIVSYSETLQNSGQPSTLAQYSTLQSVWSSTKPTGTPRESYSVASGSQLACPTANSAVGWLPAANAALPILSGLTISTVTPRTFSTTSASASGSSEITGTNTASSQSTTGTTADALTSMQGGGVSGGAIAGIVIAILAVVGGGGFLAFWMTRRKRRETGDGGPYEKTGSDRSGNVELPANHHAAAEMEGGCYHNQFGTKADWKTPYQNPEPTAFSELPGGDTRPGEQYELADGNWRPRGTMHFELDGSPVQEPPIRT